MQKNISTREQHNAARDGISAVIFDMDGVIRDSRVPLWRATRDSLESVGIRMRMSADDLHKISGLTGRTRMSDNYKVIVAVERSGSGVGNVLADNPGSDEVNSRISALIAEHINEGDEEIFDSAYKVFCGAFNRECAQGSNLIHGVRDVIDYLISDGYLVGVFSAAPKESLVQMTDLLGISDSLVVGGDEVSMNKPYPEGVAILMDRFETRSENPMGVYPWNVAYVGDNMNDIYAGSAMGCITIGVLTGQGTEMRLREAGADYIFRDLSEFRSELLRR